MRWREFALCIVGTAAIYVPASLFPAPDIRIFLSPWLMHIERAGALAAFSQPFSNYAPPYLYVLALASFLPLTNFAIIKLLAFIGACWLAWCMGHLAQVAGRDAFGAAEKTILLPTVVLNAAVLGQCDAFWTGCCVLAVTSALQDRPRHMALWAGIAFAFKAQAAFLAPFCLGQIIQRRAWTSVLIPPLIYFLAIAPAFLAGWPLNDLITVYLRQAQSSFIGNAPNLWAIPAALHLRDPSLFSIGYCLAVIGAFAVVSIRRRDPMLTALLSSIVLPFFLPMMHERFFFLADLLSLANAYLRRDRLNIALVVLIQLGSILSITAYLAGLPWLNAAGSMFTAAALWFTIAALRSREFQIAEISSDQSSAYAHPAGNPVSSSI